MQIYIDDTLVHLDGDAAALEAAFAKFKALGHDALELRGEGRPRLRVLRWKGQLIVEIQSDVMATGFAADWDQALRAVRDFERSENLFEDFGDDDCPLCQAMRDKKP
jgi:hypothetical protein